MHTQALDIRPAEGGSALADFLAVPRRLYAGDPHWVAPLDSERRHHLSGRNPYFKHASHRFLVAYREGVPVGRISAQLDDLAQRNGEPRLGHVGLVEGADAAVLAALLRAAEAWLRGRGAERVEGPYSLSVNDECGLLIEGVAGPPRMLMNHAPQWYAGAFEAAGYARVMDLIAYRFDVSKPLPRAATRLAEHAACLPNVRERPLERRHLRRELDIVLDIFNDAWSDNWGFVPMTGDEVAYMAANMKPLIRPELVRIVEVDGAPAAMIVALPDLNEALRGLDGRLLPFGWARLLWRLKVRGPRGGRVLLMGVRNAHRGGFVGSALAALLVARLHGAAGREGLRELELSWILEDNQPMRRLIETIGAEAYRRYRIYAKDLA